MTVKFFFSYPQDLIEKTQEALEIQGSKILGFNALAHVFYQIGTSVYLKPLLDCNSPAELVANSPQEWSDLFITKKKSDQALQKYFFATDLAHKMNIIEPCVLLEQPTDDFSVEAIYFVSPAKSALEKILSDMGKINSASSYATTSSEVVANQAVMQ